MHFKPRWLAYIVGAEIGLIGVKNVLVWDGDLAAVIGALSVALGMGLNDLFGSKEATASPPPS